MAGDFGDTAVKKKEANDYQVAECWGLGDDGKLYLIDMLRDKFEAYELEKSASLTSGPSIKHLTHQGFAILA